MIVVYYKFDNFIVFLDYNGFQIDGKIIEVMFFEFVDEKFKIFGWYVIKIDGYDFNQIEKVVNEVKIIKEKLIIIIVEIVKGKGVFFMENEVGWYGIVLNKEQV